MGIIIRDMLWKNEKDGIEVDGMEGLSDFCNFFNLKESPFDFGKNIGREETGILDVYMLAFRLAMEELLCDL